MPGPPKPPPGPCPNSRSCAGEAGASCPCAVATHGSTAIAAAAAIVVKPFLVIGSPFLNDRKARQKPVRAWASAHELVAEAVHGEDVLRGARVRLQLAAQPGHVHVDGA